MIITLQTFPIVCDADSYHLAYQYLSPGEQARCSRLRSQWARQSHAVARAVLRLTGVEGGTMAAKDWPIGERPGGKPYCTLPGAPEFNLSHTSDGDGLAYGILARATKPVGVDVEIVRPVADLTGMAALVLSESERRCLDSLPTMQQSRHFLRLWTLKEAILKAAGTGFAGDPRSIDFGWLPPSLLTNAVIQTINAPPFFTSELPVQNHLVAAVASTRPFEFVMDSLTTQQLHNWLATGCRTAASAATLRNL